ncbi:tyrosine-type recombinase/integrase [Catenulispora rubra]|uniref:tyrosine-type recombinase/integrase n=1 Tax=Catenulispora rubra TaxID=280293 RepID=UPI0018921294|nr:tyrosine-type recombinase/integrase [Catenulispora rubra]
MAAPKPFTPISVAEAVRRYRDALHLRVATGALSPATRDAYARDLTEAATLLGLDKTLDDVEAEDIEYALVRIANAPDRRYTRGRKAGPGGEPAPGRGLQARARWTAAVRGLFAWAAEQGYIRADPMPNVSRVRVPTRAVGARLGLTVEQAQALQETPQLAASTKELRADQRLTFRDEVILRLLTETGPRVAELCAANMTDVRQHELTGMPVLRIRSGKGGRSRDVPMSETLVALLGEYQQHERPTPPASDPEADRADAARALVVTIRGRRMTARDVQRMVERRVKQMPADLRRAVTPHGLRHTAATVLLRQAGADVGTVADILGHSDVGTTSVYLDPSATAAAEALQRSPLAQ